MSKRGARPSLKDQQTTNHREGRQSSLRFFLWRLLSNSPELWRPWRLYCALLFVIAVLGLLGYDYQDTRYPFTIVYDGRPYVRWTHHKTVGSALLDVGVEVSPTDIVEPALSSPLSRYSTVRIRRALTVLIEADGRSIEYRTHKRSAAEILEQVGIQTTDHDDIFIGGQRTPPHATIPRRDTSAQAGHTLLGHQILPWNRPPPSARLVLKRAATLYVDDGGIPNTICTTATNIGEALRDHDIILYLGDKVNPSLGSRVSTGLKIYIQRSKAVELISDGHSLHTRTRYDTVADVLAQQRIALIGSDFVEPPESTPVQDGMSIRINRVSRATVIEQETIPFETDWQPAEDVEIDTQHVEQEGAEGISKRRVHIAYHDGQEIGREQSDEWLENEPQIKIIAYGTSIVPRQVDTEAGKLTYWRKIRMLATSYSAATSGKAPDHPRYGLTRSGVPVKRGIVAVDPKVIDLNSSVYVAGYGPAKAGDTGGGINGRRIDLGFGDDDLVMWYRWVDVFLLGDHPPRDDIRWVLPNWPRERP